jgi:hypothetical protein
MQDHQAPQNRTMQPRETEKVALPRAIILHNDDDKPQTVGFPALHQAGPKRVTFTNPLFATCVSVDGTWSTECLVLTVWDTGAQLQVRRPRDLTEFDLLFTLALRPVFRQCRRVSTCGNVIAVTYQRKQPDFVLEASLDA